MISKNFISVIFVVLMSCSFSAKSDVYKFSFEGIDGKQIFLKDFKNKPILIVNTASLCGFTYQYEELERLYKKFKTKDLIVIGIPSNDFGNQELDDNKKVKEFCSLNFNITFPMTSITSIKGNDKHPFFDWVKKQGGVLSTPKWNFYKYLIDREGKLVSWFSSVTKPLSKKLLSEIEKII